MATKRVGVPHTSTGTSSSSEARTPIRPVNFSARFNTSFVITAPDHVPALGSRFLGEKMLGKYYAGGRNGCKTRNCSQTNMGGTCRPVLATVFIEAQNGKKITVLFK